MNRTILLLVTLFWMIPLLGAAGEPEHGHVHQDDLHRFHLGFGTAATQVIGESGIAPGLHLHVIRQFGEERRWGVGLGYEAIVDKHLHNGLNLLLNVKPLERLAFNIAPGISFGKHDGETEVLPAAHFEAIYEFDLAGIHLGPMIGAGIDREDAHLSVGLHIGLGF